MTVEGSSVNELLFSSAIPESHFSQETGEKDEVSVVVTSPLTRNEDWRAFGKGELVVFSEGRRLDI
jgi:predicted glutamine amidotransferase